MLKKTRVDILLQKDFHKNYKYCYNRQKYCKFTQKRYKAKQVIKKDHSEKYITTYTEIQDKNTGPSVLIHSQNVEKQCHKSFFWTFS